MVVSACGLYTYTRRSRPPDLGFARKIWELHRSPLIVEVGVHADITLDPKTEANAQALKLRERHIPPLGTIAEVTLTKEDPLTIGLLRALDNLPSLRAHRVEEFHDNLFILARNVFGGVERGESVFDFVCE